MKIKFSVLALVLFVIVNSSSVYAQSPTVAPTGAPSPTPEVFNYDRAYKDYIFIYDVYKRAQSEYLLARSQYVQAKTLAAQTKARDTTVILLQSRDDVSMTYLTALRMKLSESLGLDPIEREGYYSRLDADVAWFRAHRSSIPSAGTLEDLVVDSQEASDHFNLVTESLAWEVLSSISIGKIHDWQIKGEEILSRLEAKTNQIRSEGKHDTAITERSIIETENKFIRSLDKQNAAQGKLVNELRNAKDKRRLVESAIHDGVVNMLAESQQYVKEANNFMKEIVRQLSTAQR
jgi:hypothetical protein